MGSQFVRVGKDVKVKSRGLVDCLMMGERVMPKKKVESLEETLPDEEMWVNLAWRLK